MKVLLVDFKSPSKSIKKIVPLALLKLSTFYKNRGDIVKFCTSETVIKDFNPDIICFSCIFIFNMAGDIGCIRGFAKRFPKAKIRVGGISPTIKTDVFRKYLGDRFEIFSGINSEIEYLAPDYSLTNTSVSYGFTSRGCIRKCKWCVVPINEGEMKLDDTWTRQIGQHKIFQAFDNNILATGVDWTRSVLKEIKSRGKLVDFSQAMDCRLFAKKEGFHPLFKEYDSTFELYRFAYDSNSEDLKRSAIKTNEILSKYIKTKKSIVWYMLYGNKETIEDFWERIEIVFSCTDLNTKIKPMRFKDLDTGKYPYAGWYGNLAGAIALISGVTGLIQNSQFKEGLWGRNCIEFKRIITLLGKNINSIRKHTYKNFVFKNIHKQFILDIAEGKTTELDIKLI